MSLDTNKFKEVFVVGVDHTITSSGELVAFDSLEDLLDCLKAKNPSISGREVRVVHGLLTPARTIPSDFEGQTIFILVEDQIDEGYLFDSSAETSEELAVEIEKIMNDPEICANLVDIDDVFILYGHEINVCMSIDEEDLDEDIIETCTKVAKAAKRQLEREQNA